MNFTIFKYNIALVADCFCVVFIDKTDEQAVRYYRLIWQQIPLFLLFNNFNNEIQTVSDIVSSQEIIDIINHNPS